MAVLVALAERPGKVLSRQELLDAAWPQESVTDDVLTRSVAELRKRFDDSAGEPRFIETIRGRGYRLIAPVSEGDDDPSVPDAPSVPKSPNVPPAPTVPSRKTRAWRYGFLGLGLATALAVGALYGPARAPSQSPDAPEVGNTLRVHPLTGSMAQDRDPDVSPDGTAVAYSQWDPETRRSHIFLKLIDSGQPLQLTSGPHSDRLPVFSPDGTRLSFVRSDKESCGVFQVATTGGAIRRLTDCSPGGYLRMAWSPDGRLLARPEAIDQRTVGLSLFDMQTLESRALTAPPRDSMDKIGRAHV